jgi:hypothetical protein
VFQKISNLLKKLLKKTSAAHISSAAAVTPIVPTEDSMSLKTTDNWIPDWKEIFGDDYLLWNELLSSLKDGPKVLIATAVGGNSSLTPLETLFAAALTVRGAKVQFLLCDKILPACQNSYYSSEQELTDFLTVGPSNCDWCYGSGYKAMEGLNLPILKLSSFLTEEHRLEATEAALGVSTTISEAFTHRGIQIGESIISGALRFFGRGDFNEEPKANEVLKQFTQAAVLTQLAFENLLQEQKFDHILINQGFYVPQGTLVAVAKARKNSFFCWDLAYRQCCITMSKHDAYYRELHDESLPAWNEVTFTPKMEGAIKEYLVSRWHSEYDWFKFNETGADTKPEDIAKEVGIDLSKPIIGLLTNVVWDAQVFYESNAFKNIIDWLVYTVGYFAKRPDLQLLIRVHPAEVKSWQRSRQFAIAELLKSFGELPENVFVIEARSSINTYKAMMLCDSVLLYSTTAGLELACMGIPVVTAGEAWFRGKGIGQDVTSFDEYDKILRNLPSGSRISDEERNRALKYAYHFYLRKMIPVSSIEPQPFENASYKIPKLRLSDLAPGNDKGLDVICNGILNEGSFAFEYENRI